jgi:hypothetical protein
MFFMKTIINRLRDEVRAITRLCIRKNMPAPRMITVEICWHLDNMDDKDSWTHRTMAAGTEKKLIKQLRMRRCRKCEAQALMLAGEKINDCWVMDKTKCYWLQAD